MAAKASAREALLLDVEVVGLAATTLIMPPIWMVSARLAQWKLQKNLVEAVMAGVVNELPGAIWLLKPPEAAEQAPLGV